MSWGLFVVSLLITLTVSNLVVALWCRCGDRPTKFLRVVIFLIIHLLSVTVLPTYDISVAVVVWSVVSDLSLASFLLVSYYIVQLLFDKNRIAHHQLPSLALVIVVLSVIYYPLVLGFGTVDVYSWGINSPVLIAVIGVLSLGLSCSRYTLLALWGGLSLVAWTIGIGNSVNLFDYLIDPIASIWSMYILANHWRFFVRGKRGHPCMIQSVKQDEQIEELIKISIQEESNSLKKLY